MKNTHAIVVGGGLGGMSAALSLSAEGADVTIIEKNDHLGGKLNTLEKDGFSFDLGPSILTMPHLFERLFERHGRQFRDYVDIVPVRPHWRNFFTDGTRLDLKADPDEMNEESALDASDVEALKRFLNYARRTYRFSEKTFFERQSERKLHTLKYYNPLRIIKDSDLFRTLHEGVRRYVDNPYLAKTLDFFIKYVGSSPYDAPAVLNLLPYIQWEFDLWYVEGGMQNLGLGMERLINEAGIDVRKGRTVTEVEREGETLRAVILDDGTKLEGDLVVSNMEVIPFYEKVSKEPDARIEPYRKKYGPSCSGFALHLGVKGTYEQLAHHNVFHAEDARAHFDTIFHEGRLPKDPTIYLVAPMKTDPAQGPEGHEIIKILPHIPHLDSENPFTENEYTDFRERVLDKLERMGLKDLRKRIVTEELWTPATIEETYLSNRGSIYGVVSDKKLNMGFKTPKRSEFYRNLYFAGGSVNPGGGMPMVTLSGMQVSDRIRKDGNLKSN